MNNLKIYIAKFFVLLFFISNTFFLSCKKAPKNIFNIYPLNPYSRTSDFTTISGKFYSHKECFYIIETNLIDTSEISVKLERFISDSIKNEFLKYRSYSIWFFRSRNGFDKNFIETENDYLELYGDDMIAQYNWRDSLIYTKFIFKEGRIMLPDPK